MTSMLVEIRKHSYLQIANTEQQIRNRKLNYGMETYSETMKGRSSGRIVNQTTTKNSNRQTREEEALTEPVNNVCSFNDDEIALQKTKNAYSTGARQQYCPKSLQHCMENFEEKCTPKSVFR
jgi:hypothetical protein